MSEKRKDNKGRVLRDEEAYRKDGRYMYRYTDIKGQRCCINAHSLNELCEQEKQIQLHLDEGVATLPARLPFRSWWNATFLRSWESGITPEKTITLS